MKIFLSFIMILLIQVNGIGCSCDRISISQSYFYSEVAFLALIKENYQKEGKQYSQKLSFELIETFKGEPFDTLTTGGICRINFYEGDTVIIFGVNDTINKKVRTTICFGNRLIGFSSGLNSRGRKRDKNLAKLEIETLRFYKTLPNYNESNYRPILKNKPKSIHEHTNRFRLGVELINNVRDQAKVCHIRITFNNFGEVSKIEVLNKAPNNIKKELRNFIKNSEWNWDEKDNKKISIIETFLYPSDAIVFWDF